MVSYKAKWAKTTLRAIGLVAGAHPGQAGTNAVTIFRPRASLFLPNP